MGMKSKGNFFLLILILLLIRFGMGLTFCDEKRITLDDVKLSVVIPEGWERGVPSKGYSLLIGVLEPQTNFRANISLLITKMPGITAKSFTLDALYQSVKANLDKTFQTNYKNLEKLNMTVLGNEILVVKYDMPKENMTLSCKQYFIFENENRYLFTAVASEENFDKLEPKFDKIVSSIQLN